MTDEKFYKIVAYVKEELITKTLIQKGKEYTRGKDRLSNFKGMAAMLDCGPERALLGAWAKHLQSIFDMISDLESDNIRQHASLAQWDEKIGDVINYLILLRALIEERRDEINLIHKDDHFVCNDH